VFDPFRSYDAGEVFREGAIGQVHGIVDLEPAALDHEFQKPCEGRIPIPDVLFDIGPDPSALRSIGERRALVLGAILCFRRAEVVYGIPQPKHGSRLDDTPKPLTS
jgi:hypothetical protein